MRALLNAARREAAAVLGDVAQASTGIVTSYDPAKYAVRVTLQPQGILTGWIPLGSIWVGNGWGLYCPPTVGDLCEVDFLGGHIGAPVAGLRFYNDQDVPLSVTSGEFWLVHESGSFFKLKNDGTLSINVASSCDITASGQVMIDSPKVGTTGNFSVGSGATGTFSTPTGAVVTVQDGIITNIN